jgi:prolyl oligopeptidase
MGAAALAGFAFSSCQTTPQPAPARQAATPARTVFAPPASLELGADDADFGWMTRPEARDQLRRQLRAFSGDDDIALRLEDALTRELGAGQFNDSYTAMVGDRFLAVRNHDLVDPDEPLFDSGEIAGYDYFINDGWTSSPSGRRIAVVLTNGGTEIGKVVIYNLADGFLETDVIEPVMSASFPAWLSDDALVVATPRTVDFENDDPSKGMVLKLWRMGHGFVINDLFAADSDGARPDPNHFISAWSDPESSPLVLTYFWGGTFIRTYWAEAQDVLSGLPRWRRVAPGQQIESAIALGRDVLYLATDDDGAHSIYAWNVGDASPRLLKKGADDTAFETIASSGQGAYVIARDGENHRLFYLDPARDLKEVKLPFGGSIYELSPATGVDEKATFRMSALDRAEHFFTVEADRITETNTAQVASDSILRGRRMRVAHERAISADGAEVPITILDLAARPITQPARALVHAYGSYGTVTMNGLDDGARVWAAMGGVYAECHVRGGGIGGGTWYFAGKAPDKTKAHEDLIACGEHLVKTGRTTPKALAAMGASAGAMVVGPVGFDRPDLYRAIILRAGEINPLRMLEGVNGAAQMDEIGDPRDPAVAAILRNSDTIEKALTAERAPALFLCAGLDDTRVPWWMTARLAAIYRQRFPDEPFAISIDPAGGHSCWSTLGQHEVLRRMYDWLWRLLDP